MPWQIQPVEVVIGTCVECSSILGKWGPKCWIILGFAVQ